MGNIGIGSYGVSRSDVFVVDAISRKFKPKFRVFCNYVQWLCWLRLALFAVVF
jgi:TRAP-type C4-dicarboxylate transport system permease small subunit